MDTIASSEFSLPNRIRADRRSPARWIISHALRYWPVWTIALAGALGNAVLAAFLPVMTGQAFNAVLAPVPQMQTLFNISILLAISQFSRGILQLGRNFGFELLAQKVERDVRDELYTSLIGKSMTFHNLQPVGDTMARATNDVREVNYLFSPGVNMVVGSLTFLIMPLMIAPRYHPALILTPVIFIILYIIALRQYLRALKPVTDEVRSSFGQLNTRLAEALDGIETVKGAAQEQSEVDRFGQQCPALPGCSSAPGRYRGPVYPPLAVDGRPRFRTVPRAFSFPPGPAGCRAGDRLFWPAADAGFPHLDLNIRLFADLAWAGRRSAHPRADAARKQPRPEPAGIYRADARRGRIPGCQFCLRRRRACPAAAVL